MTGTILVVDDSQEHLHYLAAILRSKGYTVRLAPSAHAALAASRSSAPDLVLLDVKLPDINGFEVCRQLKEMNPNINLPVIFMSGLTDTAYKVKGFKFGGVDFINKPFVAEEVLVRVETHLALRRSMLETEERNAELEWEHEHAVDALRLSESRFRVAFETAAHGMALVSPQGEWLKVNRALCTIVGYEEEALLETDCHSITHPDDLESNKAYMHQVLSGSVSTFQLEKRYFHRAGHVVWVLMSASLVRDGDGLPLHFVTQVLDISARKIADAELLATKNRAEHALAQSEAHFRTLFESSNDAVMLLDENGFFDCNVSTLALFGCACQEAFCRLHPADISPPIQPQGQDSVSLANRHMATALSQGSNRFDWMHQRIDGHIFPTEVLLCTVVLDGRTVLLAVVRDITERKEVEATILLAKQEAEAANQAKAAFLATMSHEIRTPMNGLLGMADLILGTPLTEKQRHYVNTIHRSGRTLLRIINDILDLSKIQAGQMVLELLRFDLNEVIHDIIDIFAERVKNKGLAIQCKTPDKMPIHLLGDPHRLSQILFNLIGNAIKFTEEGSVRVSVAVREEREADIILGFRVTDTGIGISSEYQRQMFQNFSQEDQSISRKFGGTGLGLAITKRLVTMMDGDLGVESVPGRGSTFWFTARFGKQQEGDRREISTWQAVQRPPTPNNIRFAGHVLLVEDNQVNQEVAVATLELFGCRVTVADNGQRAITLLHKSNPSFDAIFMDCEMPILDGFEATRRLRQWESDMERPRTPVIALTAHVLEQSRQQCKEAGMDDYLRKPFSQADLGAILSRWLPQSSGDKIGNTQTVASPQELGQSSSQVDPLPLLLPGDPTDGPATSTVPVLDEVVLDRILELAVKGTPSLLSRMVECYLTRTPELLTELEHAVERHDPEGVRVAAHALKSSSLTMGVARLAELGRTMEAYHTDLARVRQHFHLSGSLFVEARQALNDLHISRQSVSEGYHECTR
ncbi:MAG: response regulator [Magnetococcales bacterium]|nr:response regulator [Magnetococcales bacterium]